MPPELRRSGVESIGIDAEGHKTVVFVPSQAKEQWPGVSVLSVQFQNLDIPEKFYEQSVAFLNAAKVLAATAGQSGAAGQAITWPQGSACYYCLHIAAELFLKACISKCTGKPPPEHHDVKRLLKRYAELLPDPELHFKIPHNWLQAGTLLTGSLDRKPDQLYRYGAAKDGTGSELFHQFVPDIVFNRTVKWLQVWRKAWQAACRDRQC